MNSGMDVIVPAVDPNDAIVNEYDSLSRVFVMIYKKPPDGLTKEEIVRMTVEAICSQDCGVDSDTVKKYLNEAINLNLPEGLSYMLCRAGEYVFAKEIHSLDALLFLLNYEAIDEDFLGYCQDGCRCGGVGCIECQ